MGNSAPAVRSSEARKLQSTVCCKHRQRQVGSRLPPPRARKATCIGGEPAATAAATSAAEPPSALAWSAGRKALCVLRARQCAHGERRSRAKCATQAREPHFTRKHQATKPAQAGVERCRPVWSSYLPASPQPRCVPRRRRHSGGGVGVRSRSLPRAVAPFASLLQCSCSDTGLARRPRKRAPQQQKSALRGGPQPVAQACRRPRHAARTGRAASSTAWCQRRERVGRRRQRRL